MESRGAPVTEPRPRDEHRQGHHQTQKPGGQDGDVGGGGGDGVLGGGSEDCQESVHTDPDHVVDGDGAEGHVEGDDHLAVII